MNEEFRESGYLLFRNALSANDLDILLNQYLEVIEIVSDRNFGNAHDSGLAEMLFEKPEMQTAAYEGMQDHPVLAEFVKKAGLFEYAEKVLDSDLGLYNRIPFRLDVPLSPTFMSAWHQDIFYTKLPPETLTFWIPMQDVDFLNGCVSIILSSHKLGPIKHNRRLPSPPGSPARYYPGDIEQHSYRYVPMKKCDLLMFHSCLLHSSNVNLSESVRYSVQPRIAPMATEKDPVAAGLVSQKNCNAAWKMAKDLA